MDIQTVAAVLHRFRPLEDAVALPAVIGQSFSGPPTGDAYVAVRPGDEAEHASSNRNRIYLKGRSGGLTEAGLDQLFDLFAAAGVKRFFVWLDPGPEVETVQGWLQERGAGPNPWVRYHALARGVQQASPAATDLTVRPVSAAEALGLLAAAPDSAWPDLPAAAAMEGTTAFFAFDGERPVASSLIWNLDGVGYLGWARTAETDRRRGAQSALISARIARAREMGCSSLVAETLSILSSSFGNLTRAGFEPACEHLVYEVRRG